MAIFLRLGKSKKSINYFVMKFMELGLNIVCLVQHSHLFMRVSLCVCVLASPSWCHELSPCPLKAGLVSLAP